MKKLRLVPPIVVFMMMACNTIPPSDSGELNKKAADCESDVWVQNMIKQLEEREDQKAEIIQYSYYNETVYYVDDCKGCADSMQIVYDCSGTQLCTFGGIAGFNTCPDFFEKATNKKVVWHN